MATRNKYGPWEPTWLPVDGPRWFVVNQRGTLLRKDGGKGLKTYQTKEDAVRVCAELNDGKKKS